MTARLHVVWPLVRLEKRLVANAFAKPKFGLSVVLAIDHKLVVEVACLRCGSYQVASNPIKDGIEALAMHCWGNCFVEALHVNPEDIPLVPRVIRRIPALDETSLRCGPQSEYTHLADSL